MTVLIIGGGPSGITASIYLAREGYDTIVVNDFMQLSQVELTSRVENYPGCKSISGEELLHTMREQAIEQGVSFREDCIHEIKPIEDTKKYLCYGDYDTYEVDRVVIATGCKPIEVELPSKDGKPFKNIHYCALCDGYIYKDKKVVVLGGGDSAFTEALHLSNIAKEVTIITRSKVFRASKSLVDRVKDNPKINILSGYTIKNTENSNGVLDKIDLYDYTDSRITLEIDGVFVAYGSKPNTDFVKDLIEVDEKGYIVCTDGFKTSLGEGIYAIGSCRKGSINQIITCAEEGARLVINNF